ncbi:MAG: hypothetical protein JG773_1275 [Spirochaeta sp.]|jgi:hypothetical protein|nr:hypothetical protein [Spirochaeta sp.]
MLLLPYYSYPYKLQSEVQIYPYFYHDGHIVTQSPPC